MLKIKTLDELNEEEMNGLKKLLNEYGNYMYEELKLVDGKNSYWKQMLDFPDEKYYKPEGGFLLAVYNDFPAACVGLRRFDEHSCEMKRMYVNPKYRGLKIAEQLCGKIIALAKEYGYSKMLLDTNKEMNAAVKLYLKYGFKEIPAYCVNVNQHPVYMEKEL